MNNMKTIEKLIAEIKDARPVDMDWSDENRKLDQIITLSQERDRIAMEETIDKAWKYIVEATRAESWSKKELIQALTPNTQSLSLVPIVTFASIEAEITFAARLASISL